MSPRIVADCEFEQELATRYGLVIGIDEAGRGALAGPVSVGVAVVGVGQSPAPIGLADSKLLSPRKRQELLIPCRDWALGSAVGMASAAEIDQWGIIAALRLAGWRAIAEVVDQGIVPRIGILDGIHDWLSQPQDLFEDLEGPSLPDSAAHVVFPVETKVKADATCTVVAAASILAKVTRDDLMSRVEDPGYGFAKHKGYASQQHVEALEKLGVGCLHRRSWKLPGVR